MQNRMSVVAVLLTVACGSMLGLVSVYHVDPIKASWSGWTHRADTVTQVLTCNFDELDSATGSYCQLFAGTKGGGGAYHVSVKTCPGGAEIATGSHDGNVDHKWVKFSLSVLHPESIVKGRQLEFKFTRGGSDSTQFYYQDGDPYPNPYGLMIVGGQRVAT